MKNNVYNPLQAYCDELVDLFQQAISKQDPALFLYAKHARTVLFMGESISRLLAEIYGDKKFATALKTFKKLEDMLGAIEDYDNYKELFSKNKSIKQEQVTYINKKFLKSVNKLNTKLLEKDFYQEFFNRLGELKIDFNDEALIKKIEHRIAEEIEESYTFYACYPEKFTDIETQVHELRRKLRWISICSQSLMGIIALKAGSQKHAWEKTFIHKDAAKTPFNKLPVKKGLKRYIYLDRKAFYALNATIEQLGNIKDKALGIEIVAKTIRKSGLSAGHPREEATKQLHLKHTENDLLKEAHELLKAFFETHKIYKKLLQS